MKIKMINEIAARFCPMTIFLNLGAISISMTDLEMGAKLASYFVAIVWTTLRVIKELKDWKKKK